MGTEWTKQDVVTIFDFYVRNLRILARRFGSSGAIEEFRLPAEWDLQNRDRHSLYVFDLAGIKASGYPAVLDKPPAPFATPAKFIEFVAEAVKNSPEGAFLIQQWRILPARMIARDPRYVAFRTAYDWVILHTKVLSEGNVAGCDDVIDLGERVDPFQVLLQTGDPDQPAGLIAGNPLHLADGGFRNRWDPNFAAPWDEVRDQLDAIRYFHFRGTLLLQELRGWPHNGAGTRDPRLLRLELLTPKAFAEFVATRLLGNSDPVRSLSWQSRPPEDVELDPRFIAHKCAFDRDMVTRMGRREAEWRRSRAETLEIIKLIGFQDCRLLFGDKIDHDGDRPN